MIKAILTMLLLVTVSQGAGFTAIVDGLDWTDTGFLTELWLSYAEREAVYDRTWSAKTNVVAGEDAQALKVADGMGWSNLQEYVEVLVPNYVDHTAVITNLLTIPMFTVTNWRSVAGVYTGGYRRATHYDPANDDWTDLADPMYTAAQTGGFGIARSGDIIGPWIFDDLQKGLSALKWTTAEGGTTTNDQFIGNVQGVLDASCATASADHLSKWAATNWTDAATDSKTIYEAWGQRRYFADPLYDFWGYRERAKALCGADNAIWTNHACSISIYSIVSEVGCTFSDMDGLGWNSDYLCFVDDIPSTQTGTQRAMTNYIGASDSPVAAVPIGCAASSVQYGIETRVNNYGGNVFYEIRKWTFSYSD